MSRLDLNGVKKIFGNSAVIKGVDLTVTDGEFCVFVGPSGCGKSTLLRLIAGLEECSEGTMSIDGHDVTDLQPARRGIAMVFQSYALYPHMTVAENMGFGLKMANTAKPDIEAAVAKAAKSLQIEHLLQRRPKDLSGGQRQRVAIGRAIVRNPKLFLFDEPLSNLDAAMRVEMRVELSRIKQSLGTTFIYVTHDQVEAMTLADKIVVLRDGLIEQVGSPLDLYRRPANRFVAGFIGSPKMNFLEVAVDFSSFGASISILPNRAIRLDQIQIPSEGLPLRPAVLGIRPEHLSIVDPQQADFHGIVRLAERLGSETLIHADSEHGVILVRQEGNADVSMGERLGFKVPSAHAHLFSTEGIRIPESKQ